MRAEKRTQQQQQQQQKSVNEFVRVLCECDLIMVCWAVLCVPFKWEEWHQRQCVAMATWFSFSKPHYRIYISLRRWFPFLYSFTYSLFLSLFFLFHALAHFLEREKISAHRYTTNKLFEDGSLLTPSAQPFLILFIYRNKLNERFIWHSSKFDPWDVIFNPYNTWKIEIKTLNIPW